MNNKSKTYAENYDVLERINNKLQNDQHNPNIIDELALMLEDASRSYIICKKRIEEAEKFIKYFESNSEKN